jgi:hypothetical protein
MSEMMRNKGIIRRISTEENIKEVYNKLVSEGKITSEFNEVDDNGVPTYIEDDNYEIINGCLFDMSDAPAEYDSYEDVEEVTKLNDTDYKIHLYYYNGGTNDSEILEEAIPKADAIYNEQDKWKNSNSLRIKITVAKYAEDYKTIVNTYEYITTVGSLCSPDDGGFYGTDQASCEAAEKIDGDHMKFENWETIKIEYMETK